MKLGRLADMPIREKLRAIIVIVSGLSVLGACAVFLTYQWFSVRRATAERLQIMAEIVADQSTAAVEFEQKPQAEAILGSLKAENQIVVAAIYSSDGGLFAHYTREDRLGGSDEQDPFGHLLPRNPGPEGTFIRDGDFVIVQPLLSGQERIGTFFLRSDRSDAWRRLRVNLATVALVLLGALATSLFLSRKLGGLITGPVLRLAEVVQTVSQRRDYAVRMEVWSRDELGQLIEGFNDMLAQIQSRDDALARARDDLELRVEERTRDLQDEIRERKAAENLLREKDDRLVEAQTIARLGSWAWNPESSRVEWFDETYRIYGDPGRTFGGTYEDFLDRAHPDDRPLFEQALERSVRDGVVFDLEFRVRRLDGQVRFLHARGKPAFATDGRVAHLSGTLQDITERKKSEEVIQLLNRELQSRMSELASANKELEGFSYSVSHDLRAPLRAIDGFGRLLQEDCSDALGEKGRRYVDVISRNTQKMGQLIDDLLDFSRMGRKAFEASLIDMEGLAKEVFAEIRDSLPGRALNLDLGPLPAVKGDQAMMRQVWLNLVSNAAKYSRDRNPARIEIGSRVDKDENVYWVRDNGVGFEMDYAHKLFGVFQRLHSAAEFEGTGVGLALVQRIVHRHGGRVWGEGKVGEGATFFFSVPHSGRETPTAGLALEAIGDRT